MTRAKPVSRRQFIAGAAGATAVGAGVLATAHTPIARALGIDSASHAASAPSSSVPAGKGTLVLVTLYGGNDGLNTVIPYHDAAYLGARPTLGYQPNEVIALDNDVALNSTMTGYKSLWDQKKLAIIRGVGYPNPNYSHFRSMDIWQSAVPESDEVTGWLGRWLDVGGGKDPLQALSLGPTLPKLLHGNTTAGSSIPSGTLTLPHGAQLEQPFSGVEASYPGQADLAARIAKSGTDLLTVVHSVRDVLSQSPDVQNNNLEGGTPAAGAANPIAGQLDLIARLIKGGLPTRVYVVSVGGFDTHVNEKTTHQRLLGELDTAVSGFVHTMAADPKGANVVVMTFSEFGRRPAQNASGGTDHGSAAPVFIAGPGVKGGFYGTQPSLTDLDNGNMKFNTDFRSVYSTVMGKVLGIDPKPILMGKSFPELPFV